MDYSQYKQLEFRRRFWVMVGAKITIHHKTTEQLVGFINMKAWKLKEDIRLYTDESMAQEVLRIHARKVIDFGATYDVIDSATNQPIFALRRKGMKSTFVRDHWDIIDPQGNLIGETQETSSSLALARRWLGFIPYVGLVADLAFAFVPQTYKITHKHATTGQPVHGGDITHRKNPLIVKMGLQTSDEAAQFDPAYRRSGYSAA